MLKVGEFSRIGNVTVRALRLYDEMGLLTPAAIDRESGYRYYTLEQLPVLNRILALKDLGFGLDQIKQLVTRGISPDELRGIFLAKQLDVERELAATQMRLARISFRLQQIERESSPVAPDVSIKAVPAVTIAGIRDLVPTVDQVGEYCEAHFALLHRWLEETGGRPAGPTMNLYHMDEYRETDLDLESAIPLLQKPNVLLGDGIACRSVPEEVEMACMVQPTTFCEIPFQVTALLSWVELNGYAINGPLREIHLFGDPRTVAPSTPVMMELQVPVRARS